MMTTHNNLHRRGIKRGAIHALPHTKMIQTASMVNKHQAKNGIAAFVAREPIVSWNNLRINDKTKQGKKNSRVLSPLPGCPKCVA